MIQPIGGKASNVDVLLGKLSKVLEQRPVLVALAGPNGAGKTTFFHAHLKPAALRFLNADEIARELESTPTKLPRSSRNSGRSWLSNGKALFLRRFSDPVGEKLGFLRETVQSGYTVVLCFIGIAGPETSEQRVWPWVGPAGEQSGSR